MKTKNWESQNLDYFAPVASFGTFQFQFPRESFSKTVEESLFLGKRNLPSPGSGADLALAPINYESLARRQTSPPSPVPPCPRRFGGGFCAMQMPADRTDGRTDRVCAARGKFACIPRRTRRPPAPPRAFAPECCGGPHLRGCEQSPFRSWQICRIPIDEIE